MKNIITYNKLVRDNIPEIISNNPNIFDLTIIKYEDDDSYCEALNQKIQEEVKELSEVLINTQDSSIREKIINEMCDILEVLYAIANFIDLDRKELDRQRILKLYERGGFSERIKLINVIEKEKESQP